MDHEYDPTVITSGPDDTCVKVSCETSTSNQCYDLNTASGQLEIDEDLCTVCINEKEEYMRVYVKYCALFFLNSSYWRILNLFY